MSCKIALATGRNEACQITGTKTSPATQTAEFKKQANQDLITPFNPLGEDNNSLRSIIQNAFNTLRELFASRASKDEQMKNQLPINIDPEEYREVAFSITSVFESRGALDALLLGDAGVISFGKHQATLASGSLAQVIERFTKITDGRDADTLLSYLTKLTAKDVSLKNDVTFLKTLKRAANNAPYEMELAQDSVFTDQYYRPAAKLAERLGLTSPLAYALFYDTKVQGGLDQIIKRTLERISDTPFTIPTDTSAIVDRVAFLLKEQKFSEQTYLKIFAEERRDYLEAVATRKQANGDNITAQYLRSSAEYRPKAFMQLIEEGNLSLTGELNVHGSSVTGLIN